LPKSCASRKPWSSFRGLRYNRASLVTLLAAERLTGFEIYRLRAFIAVAHFWLRTIGSQAIGINRLRLHRVRQRLILLRSRLILACELHAAIVSANTPTNCLSLSLATITFCESRRRGKRPAFVTPFLINDSQTPSKMSAAVIHRIFQLNLPASSLETAHNNCQLITKGPMVRSWARKSVKGELPNFLPHDSQIWGLQGMFHVKHPLRDNSTDHFLVRPGLEQ
jgi:hypothetical protein